MSGVALDWNCAGVPTTALPGAVAEQVTLHGGGVEIVIEPVFVQTWPSAWTARFQV